MVAPIKGDLKYGFDRSNKDASISLHARHLRIYTSCKRRIIDITAPLPNDPVWNACNTLIKIIRLNVTPF